MINEPKARSGWVVRSDSSQIIRNALFRMTGPQDQLKAKVAQSEEWRIFNTEQVSDEVDDWRTRSNFPHLGQIHVFLKI